MAQWMLIIICWWQSIRRPYKLVESQPKMEKQIGFAVTLGLLNWYSTISSAI